jgi:hypothetical protein
VEKSIGRTPEGLIGPDMPEEMIHVWDAFLSLHSGRTYGMNAPNPLSWVDIKAWDDLMRADMKEWEVRAVKALDGLWLRIMAEARNG